MKIGYIYHKLSFSFRVIIDKILFIIYLIQGCIILQSIVSLSLFYLIFYVADSYGAISADKIVTINQISTSGKTLIVNKGSSDELQENRYGVLLEAVDKAVGPESRKVTKKVFKPVAKVKSVKVFNESSIWIAYDIYRANSLNKGRKFILLEEVGLLKGRTDLNIQRSKIISSKKNLLKDVKKSFKESSDDLSVKKENYKVLRSLHDKESHDIADVSLVDLDIWEDEKTNGTKLPQNIYKSKHAKDFRREHQIQTFEKMVVAFIKKYNDPSFTIARRYYKEKDPNSLIEDNSSNSSYNSYLRQTQRTKVKEEKIYNDLKNLGEGWSDGYSDEELSELVYNVGVIKERQRRYIISSYQFDHQIYGHFGLNLVNNENLDDRVNTAQSKYDLEFGWEYYAFKNLENLQRFSFEFSLRRAIDAYAIGDGRNAKSAELSFAGGVNYHPFKTPNTLEENIVFVGLYVRSGVSALSVSDVDETGTYSILTLPGVRMGVKYNFSNAYGIRLFGSLENISASRIQKSEPDGVLPEVVSYTDGKLSIGFSRLF